MATCALTIELRASRPSRSSPHCHASVGIELHGSSSFRTASRLLQRTRVPSDETASCGLRTSRYRMHPHCAFLMTSAGAIAQRPRDRGVERHSHVLRRSPRSPCGACRRKERRRCHGRTTTVRACC
jgi:hypothetical protein